MAETMTTAQAPLWLLDFINAIGEISKQECWDGIEREWPKQAAKQHAESLAHDAATYREGQQAVYAEIRRLPSPIVKSDLIGWKRCAWCGDDMEGDEPHSQNDCLWFKANHEPTHGRTD